jgi:hypothetical protein
MNHGKSSAKYPSQGGGDGVGSMITCHLISAGYKEDEILLWLYENIMT